MQPSTGEGSGGSAGVTPAVHAAQLRVLLITSRTKFIDRLRAGLVGDPRITLSIGAVPAARTLISDLLADRKVRLVAADAELFDRQLLVPDRPMSVEGHPVDVLLLFERTDHPAVELCLASHAHGCLDFEASAETFARAVDAMSNGGELWFPRSMMESFYEKAFTTNSSELPHGGSAAHGTAKAPSYLTEREIEVLELAKLGLTNKEIGLRLDISPHTAKKHLHNALIKHGIRRRRQLYR